MKFFVFPYKKGSQSAKLLAQKLGGKQIKITGSSFRENIFRKCVINWGSTGIPYGAFNQASRVAMASDKLVCFNRLKLAGVSIPEFTTNKAEATWKQGVARTILNGHSGRGIVLFENGENVPDAPLYVQYIPKKEEYRVHVVREKIIHVQQKKLKQGHEPSQIRSHDNGYVFAINDIDPPQSVLQNAVKAVAALGLDFGAVDVIYNQKQDKAYVLEVNTAPGLTDTTAIKYAEAFKAL